MEKFDYINQLLPFYIELLTKKQQEIMTLYYYDNYSLSEIAEQLEISRNTLLQSLENKQVNDIVKELIDLED